MIRYTYNYLKYSFWCKKEYEDVLDGNIEKNDIVIVGLSWCPWTLRAKKLLEDEYNTTPIMIVPDIISDDYKISMLQCVSKKVNTVYVPQIWIKGEYIGDFEHLYKRHHRKQINI
jgi:glutaredoxin